MTVCWVAPFRSRIFESSRGVSAALGGVLLVYSVGGGLCLSQLSQFICPRLIVYVLHAYLNHLLELLLRHLFLHHDSGLWLR